MKLKQERIIYVGICLFSLFFSGYSFGVAWITSGCIFLIISSIFGNLIDKINIRIEGNK